MIIKIKDGILFLTEIYRNDYKSAFDSVYFSLLKKIHEKYGAKFVVELGFSTVEFRGFDLTMMSDSYKAEWNEVSDWLNFSSAQDDIRIKEEIERFAGKQSFVKTACDCNVIDQRSYYIFSKEYDPDYENKLEALASR